MPRGSGANTEPLPFIRSFGAPTDDNNVASAIASNKFLSPPSSKSPLEKQQPRERSSRDKESREKSKDKDRSSKRGDRDKDRERGGEREKDKSSRDRKRRSRSPRDEERSRRKRSRSPRRRESRRESDDYKSHRDSNRDSRDRSSRYDHATDPDSRMHSEYYHPDPQEAQDQTRVLEMPAPPPSAFPAPNNFSNNGSENNNYNNNRIAGGFTPAAADNGAGGGIPIDPAAAVREARRRSRWSITKAFVPGMPTILPSDMDDTQREVYLLQIEVEEATRKLRMNEFTTPAEERSPSPEPIYDNQGKRLNTREVRKRQELEQRRHERIQKLIKLNPEYKPPADYRPPNIRLHEKVWIPQDENPEINFVGLLIGPRGNTLKSLELETGARIIIRGKGSVKEGKLLRRDGPMPGENEPLHAFVTGTDPVVIRAACEKIKSILDDALNRPDANNMLRQHQLRELAVLNGTLRPEDVLGGTRCSNCGSDQHKTYECTEAANVTANIICSSCGGAGHIAKDCLTPRTGYQATNNEELDSEYAALLAEIDGSSSKPKQPAAGGIAQNAAPTNTMLPFRLPHQPGHPHRPQMPRNFQQQQQQPPNMGADRFYPPPPPPPTHGLAPPPGWPMPEHLDPNAAAAAHAAIAAAASNGGYSPFSLLPPPPPPPAQFDS